MRTNAYTVSGATREQILNEYALILAKKSTLSRGLRDLVVVRALAIIKQTKKDENI